MVSSLASRMVSKRWPCSRSTFSEPNNVSEQALSQQFPLRLIDGVMPCSLSTSLKSSLAYWLPRSLWKISPASLPGLRLNQAISRASITRLRCISGRIDQPTTLRLNRSITTARNNQPSAVAIYVTSPTHAWLGAATMNLRSSTLGATGRLCRLGGGNAESPLAASLNAVLLHQPLHPQLANANALRPQLPPDARPSIRSAILRIDGADVNQQCFVAEVAAPGNIHAPRQMFMVARDAHHQHPALHTDRPDQLVALNKGVLHFWHFAKYAVAFPRMSRSLVTRASSARRRLFSICSALTAGLLLAPFKVPARCSLTQLPKSCSTTPRLRAAAAWLWPDSTSRAASCLNSSV